MKNQQKSNLFEPNTLLNILLPTWPAFDSRISARENKLHENWRIRGNMDEKGKWWGKLITFPGPVNHFCLLINSKNILCPSSYQVIENEFLWFPNGLPIEYIVCLDNLSLATEQGTSHRFQVNIIPTEGESMLSNVLSCEVLLSEPYRVKTQVRLFVVGLRKQKHRESILSWNSSLLLPTKMKS